MGELKKLLEPVANGAGRDDDPYGALERRRRRRERNKRLRAGILAMVIAIGGTVFAVRAFGDGATTPADPGPQAAAFMGIWPELTLEDATAAQAAVDAGDPDAQWRLDPVAVAERFGTDALGWQVAATPPDTVAYDGSVDILITAEVAICPTPEAGAPDTCPAPRMASIVLDQPLEGGGHGIWSVEEVRTDSMKIGLERGAPLPDGPTEVRTDLDDTADAMAGFGDSSGSCMVTPLDTSGSSSVASPVSIPGSSCGDEGSYFWTMAFEDGTALPTTEAFDPFGGLNPVAVTLIPLARQTAEPSLEPSPTVDPDPTDQPEATDEAEPTESPSTGDPTGDVLHVDCSEGDTVLRSDRVRVQADGVHVRVEGQGGALDAFLKGRDAGHFDFLSKGLTGQVTEFVYPYPPGPIYIACDPVDDGPGGDLPTDLVRVDVLDPDGMWVSDILACPSTDQVQAVGFRASAGALSPLESSAIEAVRLHVPGVQPTDEVLIAEYGQFIMDTAWVIVRRDGEVLAQFQVNGHGGWGVHWGNTCKGSGIADAGNEPVNGATLGA